jgi:hypothetical protein
VKARVVPSSLLERAGVIGLRALEERLLWELREVTGKAALGPADIVEWSVSGKLLVGEGEAVAYLPKLMVFVVYRRPE